MTAGLCPHPLQGVYSGFCQPPIRTIRQIRVQEKCCPCFRRFIQIIQIRVHHPIRVIRVIRVL